MLNASGLLASMTTLYFSNNTNSFIRENITAPTNFYLIDNVGDNVLPSIIEPVGVNLTYFPKCCPPGHTYDSEYRKCVESNMTSSLYDDLGLDVNIIRAGLINCEVIVDRRIKDLKFETFMTNRSFISEDEVFLYGKYCLDKLFDGSGYIARLCYSRDYCSKNGKYWCLKKCCKDGYVMSGTNCIPEPNLGLNIKDNLDIIERNDSIAIFIDDRSCRSYVASKTKFNFTIKGNGNLRIYERKVWKEYKVDDLMYCMETHYNATTEVSRNIFKLCAVSTAGDIKFKFSKPAMVISCICLLLSIFIYIFVYKLKKIIEIIIVSYCFFLMIFYILVTVTHILPDLGRYCDGAGFTLFFCYIASFSWMNVLCFNIYHTVGSMKTSRRQSKHTLLKKMINYSIYALSIPSISTLLLYLAVKKIYEMPSFIYPYFIKGRCLISKRGGYGYIVYSAMPVGILIAVNLIFFIKTLRYYLKAKNDLEKITSVSINGKKNKMQINRKKVVMVLKLFLVMGVTWIFETVSSIINFKQNVFLETIEAVMDTFNYLQGLYVFLIFLVKWETVQPVLSKIKFERIFKKRKDYTSPSSSGTTCVILT